MWNERDQIQTQTIAIDTGQNGESVSIHNLHLLSAFDETHLATVCEIRKSGCLQLIGI